MKEHDKDILSKAIDELKQTSAAAGPPQEVVNETLTRLMQAEKACESLPPSEAAALRRSHARFSRASAVRWAAAAAVLLTAGYLAGRVSTGGRPDVDELRTALLPSLAADLEPAIRQRIMEDTRREYQQALVIGYLRMKDELTEQYQADLNRFAIQTFAASNTVTNERLEQLVEAVRESRRQDHERVAEVLAKMEASRREDTTEFGTALASLGAQMETRIEHTKSEIVRLLANTQTDASIPTPKKPSEIN